MTHDEKERLLIELLPNIRAEAARFARRTHQAIEDAIQDGLLFAWMSLDSFDPARNVKPWTYVANLVRWKLLDKFRRSLSLRRKPAGHYPEALNGDTVIDHRANERQQAREFAEWLTPCREREAAVLTAIYVGGRTCSELARDEGISCSAISSVAQRGLKRIRESSPPTPGQALTF